MNAAQISIQDNGHFAITGTLDFSTVNPLLVTSNKMFNKVGPIVLDLAGTSHANNAGLVLLLEWQDQARMRGQSLHIRNLPPALVDIARISNCLEILLRTPPQPSP